MQHRFTYNIYGCNQHRPVRLMDATTKTVTHSPNLTAILTNHIPCMRYILLASLLSLLLIHSLNLLYCKYSCTSLSAPKLNMCFGKTLTLKSLREKCTSSSEPELFFNLDDRCDYIDHEQLLEMNPSNSSLIIQQLNCRGIKSKLDEIEELLAQSKQPDVVILSETWLKEGEEKYIDIKGFKYEGINREHKKGGEEESVS